MRAMIIMGALVAAVFSLQLIFFQQGSMEQKEHASSEKKNHYRFVKVNCWFDADWQANIDCGELHTPDTQGQFTLPVVVLRSEHPQAQPDPIVYLQGGPGASAGLHTEGIKRWLSWMRLANTKRDLILIDTRGTGRSKPALVCADYNRTNQKLLRENKTLSEELSQSYTVTTQCFNNAAQHNPSLDYRHFGTQLSAQDIRALMAQLEYAEWNIIGVSYGTRLALEIARQEQITPQGVRLKSIVLDSIYPAGYGGVQTWPRVLDEAVQNFLTGCAEQLECAKKNGVQKMDLQKLFLAALDRLRSNPMQLVIKHWDGEAPINWVMNDHRFVSIIFAGIYDPADWPKIMDAIQGVNEGRTDMVKPLSEPYLNQSVSADFNSLTFTAVDCADNPVLPEAEYLATVANFPLLQGYTRDQWRYQSCHELPAKAPLQLTRPNVPTLILAGAKDPITPVNWAKEIHQRWPGTQLRINENLAHSVLGSDICLLENLVKFFDQPQAAFTACTQVAQATSDIPVARK